MKNKEYVMHITSELLNFFLEDYPRNMNINLHQEDSGLHICIIDSNQRTPEELKAIDAALNTTARPELAEYYGTMGGSDLLGKARLNIFGWQVKYAHITHSEQGTHLDLWLGGDDFDESLFHIPEAAVKHKPRNATDQ